MSSPKVIVVDLDGTLTLTDTLHEAILALVRLKPFMLFLLPFWLIRGIAHLKLKVAENSLLDITTLPYNLPFIDWLKEQKVKGHKIVISTAANERIANAVSRHLGIFDDVIASDAHTNLKCTNKLNKLIERYGDQGFDYAGNSSADIKVWAGASQAIVVNANKKVQAKASKVASVLKTFPPDRPTALDWFKALRLHQWLKNLLLFVPFIAAHQIGNFQSFIILVFSFFTFSLCASSVYIINDLFDLESDRRHPHKKHRSFASGKLPISFGLAFALFLIGPSIALAATLGSDFLLILVFYLLLTILYSLVLKRIELLDCLTLATLYTSRIIAGAVAVSISLSFWLLAFSIFIFLSLALVKRYAELILQAQSGKTNVHGRGYLVSDASLVRTLGVSSGYIATLIIALYVQSEEVVTLYAEPMAILLVLPILLFWISWVWLKAERGEMHDDPIVFAIKDKKSLLVLVLNVFVFTYATTGMGN